MDQEHRPGMYNTTPIQYAIEEVFGELQAAVADFLRNHISRQVLDLMLMRFRTLIEAHMRIVGVWDDFIKNTGSRNEAIDEFAKERYNIDIFKLF